MTLTGPYVGNPRVIPSGNTSVGSIADNPTPAQASGAANLDAKGTITGFLEQYGLGSLADWAWGQFIGGVPISQIMVDLRSRPEYKQRFPAMDTLAKKGRAMSEAEYVSYERQAAGLFRVAGLPASFYDKPGDFAKLIENEVSVNELSQRVQTAYTAVYSAPAEVKKAFADFYGPDSDGALAAYMLDPNKALPVIEQQISSAQFAGIGTRFGYNLNKGEAEGLGREGLTQDQISSGFQRADSLRPLADENLAEAARGNDITEGDLLQSSFGMRTDRPVRRRLQERTAAFQGSGGASTTNTGATGLGGSQKG